MTTPIDRWNNAVKIGDKLDNVAQDYKKYTLFQDLLNYVKPKGEGGFVGKQEMPSKVKFFDVTGTIKETTKKIKVKGVRDHFKKFKNSQKNTRFKPFTEAGFDTENLYNKAFNVAKEQIIKRAAGRAVQSMAQVVSEQVPEGVIGDRTRALGNIAEEVGRRALGKTKMEQIKSAGKSVATAYGLGASAVSAAKSVLPDPTSFQAPVSTPEGIKSATFAGPGTDILGKIKTEELPVNPVDMAALEHDIAYGLATNNAMIRKADNRFVKRLSAIAKLHPDDSYNSMLIGGAIKAKMLTETFIPEFAGGVLYDDKEWLSKQTPEDKKLLKTLYKKINKMSSKKFVQSFRDPKIFSPLGASKALALVPGEGAKTLTEQVVVPMKMVNEAVSLTEAKAEPEAEPEAETPKAPEIKPPEVKEKPMGKELVVFNPVEQQKIYEDLKTKYENIKVQQLKEQEEQTFNKRERKIRPEFREFNPDRLNIFLNRRHEAEENKLYASFNYVPDDDLKPDGGDNPLYEDNLLNDAIRYGYTILLPRDFQPTGTNMLVARNGVRPSKPKKLPQGEDVEIPANNSKGRFRTLDKSIYRNLRKNR